MLRPAWIIVLLLMSVRIASAQSPEISMREFASGQIKKGVRSIGFGGNGATWGNYGLVYLEHDTVVVDGGSTVYTNGNVFGFTAAGITTPQLWHGLAIYVLGLAQMASNIKLSLHDENLGPAMLPVRGDGVDGLVALRLAMPLGSGFSIGIQLSYEVSRFDATLDNNSATIHYRTEWLPSGGVGVAWRPNPRVLVGARVILNHDWERRFDGVGGRQGLNRSYEYRAGLSFSPWKGALIDLGGTVLDRANGITNTESVVGGANLGFEQAFYGRLFALRAGVDECQLGFGSACSATAGLSVRRGPVNVDVAYVYNLGQARIGSLFGQESHTGLMTLTLDFGALIRRR